MTPIIDGDKLGAPAHFQPLSFSGPNKPSLKMVFHFPRILDSDITVDGESEGMCLDKALAERMKQCRPISVKGEVVE